MATKWEQYWGEESNRGYWLEPDRAVIELKDSLDASQIRDVLDLGCGIGRHALLFAELGFKVTAVDSSQEALDVLRKSAEEKGVPVEIIEGDYSEDLFPEQTFHLVVAYNVLYHGYRQTFKDAVNLVHGWLKPGGLFFFTCPTRRDDRYGNGEEEAENTYRPLNSIHPGDIHYFSNEADIEEFLSKFSSFTREVHEHHWNNKGTVQFSSYWKILARK